MAAAIAGDRKQEAGSGDADDRARPRLSSELFTGA